MRLSWNHPIGHGRCHVGGVGGLALSTLSSERWAYQTDGRSHPTAVLADGQQGTAYPPPWDPQGLPCVQANAHDRKAGFRAWAEAPDAIRTHGAGPASTVGGSPVRRGIAGRERLAPPFIHHVQGLAPGVVDDVREPGNVQVRSNAVGSLW